MEMDFIRQLQQRGYFAWTPYPPDDAKAGHEIGEMREWFKAAVKEGLMTDAEFEALDDYMRTSDSRSYRWRHAYND
jgi:hypothetical protein